MFFFGGKSLKIADRPCTSKDIDYLKLLFEQAETVIVGAGAGLSTSAGYTYSGERYEKYFGDFKTKYGISNMYEGSFYHYKTKEEMWAFFSRDFYINRYVMPEIPVYEKIFELIDGRDKTNPEKAPKKDYFIITTNVDHCFQRFGFEKKRLFYTQGDYGLLQCSVPCLQKTYDSEESLKKMLIDQGFTIDKDGNLLPPLKPNGKTDFEKLKMSVSSSLLPSCPNCGKPLRENLRDDEKFVEDDGWNAASKNYEQFLKTHNNTKTLFLELAVGFNTPGIIKYPFWRMTKEWKDAKYVCINLEDACCPQEIGEKALCISGDIAEILSKL